MSMSTRCAGAGTFADLAITTRIALAYEPGSFSGATAAVA